MSCNNGNRFMCGLRRFDQHKVFEADRPTNSQLHNEMEQRMAELIKKREQQDTKYSLAPTVLGTSLHGTKQ